LQHFSGKSSLKELPKWSLFLKNAAKRATKKSYPKKLPPPKKMLA
jgi:hypothetical protein